MPKVHFQITGFIENMPEGTTTDGIRIYAPDGQVLAPVIYFEEEEKVQKDLGEGELAMHYGTDINYDREVSIEEQA